jgi:hypothetical protein
MAREAGRQVSPVVMSRPSLRAYCSTLFTTGYKRLTEGGCGGAFTFWFFEVLAFGFSGFLAFGFSGFWTFGFLLWEAFGKEKNC